MSGASVDGAAAGGPPSPTRADGPKLEGSALQEALRAQLEFYFSKQNLATDSYLLAQMNQHPNKSVPIDILAGFRKIKSLTDSKAAIIQALKLCKNITLDEEKGLVRSALKVERSTLILRDMAADASEAELRQAFEERPESLCKGKLLSLTPDINDTWFVTFDSESTCMDVCMDIQSNSFSEKAYTYRGRPIQARVKNESLNRGFYTAPPGQSMAPPNGQSSILVGGPVGAAMGPAFNPYMQPQMYGFQPQYLAGQQYAGQYMPMVAPLGGVPQVQSKKVTSAPQAGAPAPAGAAPAVSKKAAKKAAAAAAAAGGAAPVTSPSAAPTSETPPPASTTPGADGAAVPKKKKAKKAAAAAEAAGGAMMAPHQESQQDKSHLVQLYGHSPRLYSREQIAHVVNSFINMARANSSLMKRPDGFAACNDPDKVVLKTAPATAFSILDPFPVIYPASPSPLLAAQPHHSNALPFLELGSGALDAPYFAADSGFNVQAQGAAGRRKSKSEAAVGKSQAPGQPKAANSAKPRQPASPSQKPRPAPTAGAPQPKIVPPPAIQPAGSILNTVATAGTQAQPSKPTSFAAAALAAANAPIQQAPKPAAKPAASKAAAPAVTSPPAGGAAAAGAKKEPKAKKPKQPTAAAAANNGANPAAAAAAAPAKPVVPVVNYASRVGAISPAELAAKQAAQKAQKEAKEPASSAAPAAAASGAQATKPAAAKPAAAAPTAAAASAVPESSPSKAASTFSYAAMIKKAPEKSPVSATAPTATASAPKPAAAATPAKDNGKRAEETVAAAAIAAAGPPKSDAGNWRSH